MCTVYSGGIYVVTIQIITHYSKIFLPKPFDHPQSLLRSWNLQLIFNAVSMNFCKYALHKHAQQTIEQNWWKNRGVALLCALLSPHSRQHPPSHQCLDFHTLWVISHTHNMQVSTPLLIFLHTSRSFTHWQNVPTHSMGHQVETCQHSHPPIWSFAKWQI